MAIVMKDGAMHLIKSRFVFTTNSEARKLYWDACSKLMDHPETWNTSFVGLALVGKDVEMFRFIIEYSSLRDFGPWVITGSFLYEFFLKDNILVCVET